VLTKDEFRKLQLTQLEIMDEVHRICEKNGIQYYIIGGTALGAVRHGGFIPWDLDIDIAMKRADYDHFKEACEKDLDNRYIYRDYANTHDFNHPHALLCIQNTVLVNKFDKFNPGKENLGIYLDIFPLDNAPVEEEKWTQQAKELSRIKRLKEFKYGMCYQKHPLKTFVKKVISLSIFWTSVDRINKKMDDCMRRYSQEKTGFLCSMASHYSYGKQYMPEEIYGVPQLVAFEDRKYYAPQDLDAYLTRIYKDYMKLPPEKDRQLNLGVFEKVVFDK
jgi:lipopolysaccharide cholinephosphotransferase